MAIPGFLFGGDTGLTQEQLAQRRRVLEAMVARGIGAPKNVGEGLVAVGNALAYRMQRDRLAKGETELNDQRKSILSGLFGGGDDGGAAAATAPATMPATATGGPQSYRDAIASIESAGSGDYAAIGPTNAKLGRPLGRYQIMESNIGPWSQEALGRQVTADEFLKDPALQDKIFDHKFQGYVQQYGHEGAAQAWLGGPGSVGKTNRKDVLGTSVGEYGSRFMKALGPQEVASLDPSIGMPTAAAAIEKTAPGSGTVDPYVSAPNGTTLPAGNIPVPQPRPSVAAVAGALQERGLSSAAQVSPAVQQVAGALAARQAPPAQPQQVAQAPMPQQSGPSLQQLYQAAANPALTEQDRAIVNTMIEQRMQQDQAAQQEQSWRARQAYEQQAQQADPAYQIEQEYKRAQIEALRVKPVKEWQRLDDSTLFNPETGETRSASSAPAGSGGFRFDGKSVEAQALNGLMDAGTLTPAQAQQLGAGKTITGPNGEIIFMTPQGVFSQPSAGQSPAPMAAGPAQSGGAPIGGPMPQPGAQVAPMSAVPQVAAPPPVPNANGMIRLTEPKNTNAQIPAEMGARIGMGDAFLQELPAIREKIARGDASGPIDGFKLQMGMGEPMDIWRNIETGRDALVRNLTGAGMSASEANNQAARYQIAPTDSAETMLSKLDNLERDLRATRAGAIGARTGSMGDAPPAGGDPLSAARAAIAKGAPRDAVIQRLRQSGINPEGL